MISGWAKRGLKSKAGKVLKAADELVGKVSGEHSAKRVETRKPVRNSGPVSDSYTRMWKKDEYADGGKVIQRRPNGKAC